MYYFLFFCNDNIIVSEHLKFLLQADAADLEQIAELRTQILSAKDKFMRDDKVEITSVHVCLYCQKPNSRISRHYLAAHREEPEVIETASEKDGIRKESLMTCLVRKGDYAENQSRIRVSKFPIVVVRVEDGQNMAKEYGPCRHCLGFFLLK